VPEYGSDAWMAKNEAWVAAFERHAQTGSGWEQVVELNTALFGDPWDQMYSEILSE